MRYIKTLHLASFDGNIGDNANHDGFYKNLKMLKEFKFNIDKLEIREFYWKKKFFDESFVSLVNEYDLLIIGGGNYFELWVERSPTGTSISIQLDLLKKIKTPIFFNALGVDPGQGVTNKNLEKFRCFLDALIERKDFISIRNDGSKKAINEHVGEKYMEHIHHTVDAGFFAKTFETPDYFSSKKYIAINIATDMPKIRFKDISYQDFIKTMERFIQKFLLDYDDHEVVLVPHIFRDIAFINDLLINLNDEIRRKKVTIAPLMHGKDSFKYTLSIYKGAKLVLANRFHANVCSIGLGVPTIGLVNYRQIKELYEELNSSNYTYITQKGFDINLFEKLSNIEKIDIKPLQETYGSFFKKFELWMKKK